jgi:hypothetical protein
MPLVQIITNEVTNANGCVPIKKHGIKKPMGWIIFSTECAICVEL